MSKLNSLHLHYSFLYNFYFAQGTSATIWPIIVRKPIEKLFFKIICKICLFLPSPTHIHYLVIQWKLSVEKQFYNLVTMWQLWYKVFRLNTSWMFTVKVKVLHTLIQLKHALSHFKNADDGWNLTLMLIICF